MALATASTPQSWPDPLQLRRRLVLQGAAFALLLLSAFSAALYWGIAAERRQSLRAEALQLAGVSLDLTRKEALLLETLLRAGGHSCSKAQLLDASADGRRDVGEETIKAHMRNLRSKLTAAGAAPDLIETVYGLGYRLNPTLAA